MILDMARILDDSAEHFKGTRVGRHPWADYFNGKTWLLENGVDFTCAPASMRASAASAAARMGYSVKTRITPEQHLKLQATKKETVKPETADEADE